MASLQMTVWLYLFDDIFTFVCVCACMHACVCVCVSRLSKSIEYKDPSYPIQLSTVDASVDENT